ncbi:PTS mannitol transporter subunit IICB [Acidipropionibacterium jensenii]|uniref:PTS mannitol transporter subunit IICB n=1 Tax=Acidipropionibacterium jensenii TaxID=1749 RepID=UPI001C2FE31A|nr:PTS transporter subunit EIIC [Acidipropionibacterium jensenii]MDN6441462.1 PTS transporter subunit EIIC [Acidipropionibacterium jensenii]MDN6512449.1 PTS transporter subunit EIIC [Acidipropionibacterium jensenii]MDN6791605.1 PTS transporter subunit EIIC [Acidipropionibacterium jensenii]
MMTTEVSPPAQSGLKRAQVGAQKFGTFLSGMVMPNLPAFVAWGLITALFIATGWAPNGILGGFGNADLIGWQGAATTLAKAANGATFTQYVGLVQPMITYLLPLLIANSAGRIVYGERGGVVGSIATVGVIVGSTIPMFMGAMVVGPLAAWIMKKIDSIWDGKIKPGFEMLVNMFSAGIVSAGLSVAAFFGVAPLVTQVSSWLGSGAAWLASHQLLPVLAVIVEPAKVLFLNNAIGNGVLVPLATQQTIEAGKSLLFLVESNPGPGLGILMAYTFFGIGAAKASAPGAAVIQFIGGIHEVYFPYVLMKPTLILAAILGGATGIATNAVFGSGLRAPAAPGSIIAVIAQTPRGSFIGVILSVVLAAAVSFIVASVILRASRRRDLAAGKTGDLSAAIAQTEANKGGSIAVLGNLGDQKSEDAQTGSPAAAAAGPVATAEPSMASVHKIIFACDAGMGSSAMGASVLRSRLKKAGVEGVTVTNLAVASLSDDVDLVITQRELTDRARQKAPSAKHLSVDNFMNSPVYETVVTEIKEAQEAESHE